MIKLLQKDFRKLIPPVLASEYNTNNPYCNFEECPRIFYSLGESVVSEPFPILVPELGCSYDDCLRQTRTLDLGKSVPTSDLETTRDCWEDDMDEEVVYVVYEPEDIRRMINKLEACIHDN